jgi:hypothetical protein
MAVGKGGTWMLSSGVEGATGEGEREAVVVREGEEEDMTEEERKGVNTTDPPAFLAFSRLHNSLRKLNA